MNQFKFHSKEKFTVITPLIEILSANFTEELMDVCKNVLMKPIKNLVLNLENINAIDLSIAQTLIHLREDFYNNAASFVVCSLSENVKQFLEENDLLDELNITPTESEAWDIVQMEEIERELMGDDPEA